MPKGLTFLPSLAIAAMLALPSVAETTPNADTVVASVNGEDITLGHMILSRAALPQQYQDLGDDVLFEAILDQLIEQNLLRQAWGKDIPKHIELTLENEERSLIAAQMLDKVALAAINDEVIQSAYDAKYADGFGDEEYNASHILVETEDEAKALKTDLDAGADFAETAKEKSTGPSGPNGGELGWFGKGRMVPEFEAAVLGLEPGQISDPVKTQFGWHVIVLNDKRRATAPELDAVRQELTSAIQRDAIDTEIAKLTNSAEIVKQLSNGVEPEMLLQLDLLQGE